MSRPPKIPGRRGFLAGLGGVSALALGAGAAIAAPITGSASVSTASPDAKLIALCAEFNALEQRHRDITDSNMEETDNSRYDHETRAILDQQGALAEHIAEWRCITAEGVRAKAGALHAWAPDLRDDPLPGVEEQLLASLLRDLTGGTPQIAAPALTTSAAASDRHPDAELICVCAEHIVNIDAYNRHGGTLEDKDDPFWAAYERSRNAISAAKPRTVQGMLAKAHSAKAEAMLPDGTEEPNGSVSADWAWELMNDLLRLHGRA